MEFTYEQIEKQCEELGIEPGTYYFHRIKTECGGLGEDWARRALAGEWQPKGVTSLYLVPDNPVMALKNIMARDLIFRMLDNLPFSPVVFWREGCNPVFDSAGSLLKMIGEDELEKWGELGGSDRDQAISLVRELDWGLACENEWRAIGTCQGSENNEQLTGIIVFMAKKGG